MWKNWDVAILLSIPLLLTAANRNWVFPTLIHDPWIYLGYGLDPWRMLKKYASHYYSDRLTVILPVALVHSILPPVSAHLVLHLTLYYASIFSLFVLVSKVIGRKTGFVVSLAMGTYYFFLDAVARDYSDAFGITYFVVASLLASKEPARLWSRIAFVAAGAFAAAMVVANLFYVIVGPFPAVNYLIARRRDSFRFSFVRFLFWYCVGAIALFLLLALVTKVFFGHFLFLHTSLAAARVLYVNPDPKLLINGIPENRFPNNLWVLDAVWLALGLVVCGASIVVLVLSRKRGRQKRFEAGIVWPAQFAALFLVFLSIDLLTGTTTLLQFWYYESTLIPAMMLALAALLAPLTETLDNRDYALLAVFSLTAFIAQAVYPWPYTYQYPWPVAPLLLSVLPALGAVGLIVCYPTRRAVWAIPLLLAMSMFVARIGFSEEKSYPIYRRMNTSRDFQPTEGTRQLLPYVQRIHQYDHHRGEVYTAVVESARIVRHFDAQNDVVYWFDMSDPHAIVYDNLACTRCWGYSVLNFNFPNITEAKKFDRTEVHAGQLIAIPSVRSNAYDFAKLALRGIGFDAGLVDRRNIAHGAIKFTITLVELRPLERKDISSPR